MILERDYLRENYVIHIPREELIRMFVRAHDNAYRYGVTEDELVSKELSERILCLINSDMRGKENETDN